MTNRPIYLDYQATTPMDPRAVAAMVPYFTDRFGNAHAQENGHGLEAGRALAEARRQVAGLVCADQRCVVFTSGATEANNLLIRGAARYQAQKGRPGVITTAIEHKAVLDVVRLLEAEGHPIKILDTGPDGLLDPGALKASIDDRTGLVSVMAANNEVGVIQPLQALAETCSEAGVLFHTDAAQAAGKVEIDLETTPIDLLSISAHKLYGPQGIGAAIGSRKALRNVAPLFAGGGQEAGIRPGTVPLALCVGFGTACEIASIEGHGDEYRLRALSAAFLHALDEHGVEYDINGSMTARLGGNLNLSFRDVDAEALLMVTRDKLSLSTGSACTSGSLEPSHVLKAIGLKAERAESAVRVGFGRPTTEAEVLEAAQLLAVAIQQLRGLSYAPPVGTARGRV